MASKNLSTDSEGSVFQVLEGVVYYVDPTTSSDAMNAFVVEWQQRACTYSFIEKALLLTAIWKARGKTCTPQRVNSVLYSPCNCLMRPMKVLAKILFLHICTKLKDCNQCECQCKCNQFCLCRVQGHPVNCFCKITVRRSTYCLEISKA